MNTKHTPGPWTIAGGRGKHGDLYIWQNVKGIMPEHAIATVHEEMIEGAQGNARLIAAAPDAARACELLTAWIDGRRGDDPSWLETQAHALKEAYIAAQIANRKVAGEA